jgi:phosphatidylglycerophosphate synthase
MTSETPEAPEGLENRRPLKSRGTAWAKALAQALDRGHASPDMISAASVAFAVLGGALFMLAGVMETGPSGTLVRGAALIGAGVCIQLRLLCNLLDGMVAVEHGRASHAGPIWNELPDRLADALFLVGAGYCAYGSGYEAGGWLGWVAAWLAVLTAYVRELGRGLGFPADFSGPMAKPHRMAALTLIAAVSAFEPAWGWRGQTVMIGLTVIVLGSALTGARRVRTLSNRLRDKADAPAP